MEVTDEMVVTWRVAAKHYRENPSTRSPKEFKDSSNKEQRDQALRFGNLIENLLKSDAGDAAKALLGESRRRITFSVSEEVYLNREGLWRGHNSDCSLEPEPITACDAALAALRAGTSDPFQYLLEELNRIAKIAPK